jgi:hypothetical protein
VDVQALPSEWGSYRGKDDGERGLFAQAVTCQKLEGEQISFALHSSVGGLTRRPCGQEHRPARLSPAEADLESFAMQKIA